MNIHFSFDVQTPNTDFLSAKKEIEDIRQQIKTNITACPNLEIAPVPVTHDGKDGYAVLCECGNVFFIEDTPTQIPATGICPACERTLSLY